MFQHQKHFGCREGRKTGQNIYTDCVELKKITIRIYSNCSIYSFLFSSPSNFVAVRFVSLKNNLQLTVQVCCLLYFLLHGRLFKGKAKSGIYCFFKCFFGGLGPITSTLLATLFLTQ